MRPSEIRQPQTDHPSDTGPPETRSRDMQSPNPQPPSSPPRRLEPPRRRPREADRCLSMLVRLALAITACVLGYFLWSLPAQADDTAVGGIAGDLYPLESTTIRMESETVQAIMFRRFAEFRVDFKFVNSGAPQRLMLGFPFVLLGPEDNGVPPLAFRAWQDGQPLSVREGKGYYEGEERGYFLHLVDFPAGETLITVSYLAQPTWSSGDRFPELAPPEMKKVQNVAFLAGHYMYWLHTGASWAGTIGKAVVRFVLADDCDAWGLNIKSSHPLVHEGWPWTTKPESYTNPDPRTFHWEFNDFEPTEDDDIRLAFTAPFPTESDNPTLPPIFGAVLWPPPGSSPGPTDETAPTWMAVDGSAHSAWKTRIGAGETGLKLNVTGQHEIREFRILTGLNQTLSSFTENGRPKTVKVTLSDGSTATFELKDEPTVQRFPLEGRADWVQVDILETYPGTKSDDVYISEIGLGAEPAPQFLSFTELLTGNIVPSTTSVITPATSSSDTTASAGSSSSLGPGGQSPAVSDSWPVWPVVAFGVAGAAFLVLVALLVVAIRRR